ncbi:hypothetical protein Btru_076013 [Bulinus truncatus]|nr:hypothetical protein Btru_076013 [Bulinus truncatus]
MRPSMNESIAAPLTRLEKLFDTYANLAQLGNTSPVNRFHRKDSPIDFAKDGIDSGDRRLGYLGEDDTNENSLKAIDSELRDLSLGQAQDDAEDDARDDAGKGHGPYFPIRKNGSAETFQNKKKHKQPSEPTQASGKHLRGEQIDTRQSRRIGQQNPY